MVDMRMGFRGVPRLFLRGNLKLNPIEVLSLPGTLSNRERATCLTHLTLFSVSDFIRFASPDGHNQPKRETETYVCDRVSGDVGVSD